MKVAKRKDLEDIRDQALLHSTKCSKKWRKSLKRKVSYRFWEYFHDTVWLLISWLDDLLVVQQASLKTFLKKMVEGFEVVMNKINTVVPRIEEEQERVSEIVDSLKDHIPSLNT